jgi:hypothetical protein
MQSPFESLSAIAGENPSLVIGLILMGALSIQLAIEIGRGLRRLHFDRLQQRVTLQRLRLQVVETRLRCHHAEQVQLVWNGYRKFTVAKKLTECADVCAFYLQPHDGKPLPAFKPGQYLTFQLTM